ncbi:MAG: DUF4625 domain-containing protein [Chitinophagales bacterium]
MENKGKVMKSSFWSILLMGIIMGVFACVPIDIDETDPSLTVISPVNGESLLSGEVLNFESDFVDDHTLSRYTLSIADTFNLANNWDTLLTKRISGINTMVDIGIAVPVMAKTGVYELTVSCEDENNNNSSISTRYIQIQNSIDQNAPSFNILTPSTTTTTSTFAGGNLVVVGSVEGETGQIISQIKLFNSNGEEVYASQPQTLPDMVNGYSVQEVVLLPEEAGSYQMVLYATDEVNNQGTVNFQLELL